MTCSHAKTGIARGRGRRHPHRQLQPVVAGVVSGLHDREQVQAERRRQKHGAVRHGVQHRPG
jgi:hypothetical protein